MLVVFGSINVDFVFPVPHLPQPGDVVQSSFRAARAGGHGANQAIAAAADGTRVTLVGAVGTDALADIALDGLRRGKVHTRHIARVQLQTGRSAVMIDRKGRNTVVTDPGANAAARMSQLPDALLGKRTTLLLQLGLDLEETASLILRARALGCRVVINLAPPRPLAAAVLRAADLLIGNADEIAWLGEHLGTGNNPASLHAALGVATVRMMGERGAEAMSADGYLRIPAMPVLARDTTGAADTFTGVLAGALDRRHSFPDALRRATVAASLSTTEFGERRLAPSSTEIDHALPHAPHPSPHQPTLS